MPTYHSSSAPSESKLSMIRVKTSRGVDMIQLFTLTIIKYQGIFRTYYNQFITDSHFVKNQHIINHTYF